MKQLIVILSLLLMLFACSPPDRQQSAVNAPVDIRTFDTLVPFEGYWISEDYINSIHTYGSPKKAQTGALFIGLPRRTLLPTMMIGDFHEGGPDLTVVKGDGYQLWQVLDDSTMNYSCDIEMINPTCIKIRDTRFVKINSEGRTPEHNYLILEELLFKGDYTNEDGLSVEFKNNGEVAGLDSFRYYTPIIDYYDAGMQVDQLSLTVTRDKREWYGFTFDADTLEIFKLNCDVDDTLNQYGGGCLEVSLGQRLYKLWKHK